MIMQIESQMQVIGLMLMIFGIFAIIAGILSHIMSSMEHPESEHKVESRGVILLGPIPIVWGYGKRGWIIAGIAAISLYVIILVVFG